MTEPNRTIEELRKRCVAQAGQITAQEHEIAAREREIAAREREIAVLETEIRLMREKHNLAILRQFGRSSEQSPAGQEAFVFNEAETFCDPTLPEPTVEEVVKQHTRRKPGQRQEKVANLETRDMEYPATEEQQICACCGEQMHFVEWQVRQDVEYIPAKAVLVNHKQPTYACRGCQESGEPAPIRTIKTMPEPAFPKSLASPSLVSHIITQKFVMGAPVYRLEHNMEGLGIHFSRQTMCNWIVRAATLVRPIYDRMHQELLTRDIIHADETSVQVLREPGRAATTDSTMWLYRTGRDGPVIGASAGCASPTGPIILFDYQMTRAGKHARDFLTGFGGYDPETNTITQIKFMNVDGYDGYNVVPTTALIDGRKQADVLLAGCWAHARRKFFEASAIVKPKDRKSSKRIVADEGLKLCDELYGLERDFRDMTAEERHAARNNHSAAKLSEIKEWLDKNVLDVTHKGPTGMAIAYTLSQWTKLNTFLLDGRIEIDNNRAERSIKPFVIGRKNWLFANTPTGAVSSATLYSVIETAKENKLIPFEYVKYLLERLPNIDTQDPEALNALLPWSTELPDRCRKP